MFTGWLSAPSRLGEVFVAFTRDGVQFVRSGRVGRRRPRGVRRRPTAGASRRPLRPADRGPGRPAARAARDGAAPLRGWTWAACPTFERDVLAATRRIPAGETRPYGWVAREAGRPRRSARSPSVLARNPVPLLVPCHRVVRADGALGEYMFGPARKETSCCAASTPNLDDVADFARRGVHYLGSDTHRHRLLPDLPQRPPHQPRRTGPGSPRSADAVAAGYRPCRICRPAVAA